MQNELHTDKRLMAKLYISVSLTFMLVASGKHIKKRLSKLPLARMKEGGWYRSTASANIQWPRFAACHINLVATKIGLNNNLLGSAWFLFALVWLSS